MSMNKYREFTSHAYDSWQSFFFLPVFIRISVEALMGLNSYKKG